jgi:CHAD domain-containing protein
MASSGAASSFASNSISKLLQRLAYQIGATAHSPTAEKVHDLRVAIRRFEQALAAFRQSLPGHEVKRIQRKLKGLMERAGSVRDCDVLQKLLLKCDAAGVAAFQEALAEERKAKLPALTTALRRWSARRSFAKWRTALTPVDAPADFHAHLPKLARKFLAHGEKASGAKVSAGDLHAFRIEGKKLRYTLELFEPLYGAPVREWLDTLKPLQSALGDVQDCRTARGLAQQFDASPAVIAWLKKRQRKKSREFRQLWHNSFSGNDRLVAALRHTPRKPVSRASTTAASGTAREA